MFGEAWTSLYSVSNNVRVFFWVEPRTSLFLWPASHLPWAKSLSHCYRAGGGDESFFFLGWHSWFIRRALGRSRSLWSSQLLLVWNFHAVSELGWRWWGPQYSQALAVPGVEPLSYDLVTAGRWGAPDSLAELTCSLGSAVWNWEGIRSTDGLALVVWDTTIELACELDWSFWSHWTGGGREIAGDGLSATNSHCFYQDLVDFLK